MSAPTSRTAPASWDGAVAARAAGRFDPHAYRTVVVVAAHPDDETLGVGGAVQALAAAGARLRIVVATDGEAAFPDLPPARRGELARTRRAELETALRALGLAGAELVYARLPDSGVDRHVAELAELLSPLLADADACLAPWTGDPHPDHRSAGLAARAATGTGTRLWWYPIWMRPWMTPDAETVPWPDAATYWLTEDERHRKHTAICGFTSQLEAGPDGADPVLPPDVLAHFAGDTELLFRADPAGAREPAPEAAVPRRPGTADSRLSGERPSTPVATFVAHYEHDPDPWHTFDSGYERRKRAVTLACLPREHYGRALDAGCGTGALTAELRERCDTLLALDAVPHAVESTRTLLAHRDGVTVRRARLPAGFPPGRFDLVVFSELLYYLGPDDLESTLRRAARALAPGGDLLAVAWRHRAGDAPSDAETVHGRLTALPDWDVLVAHRETDFLLHVVRRR